LEGNSLILLLLVKVIRFLAPGSDCGLQTV
jgi:hypothetical protein